MSTPFKVALYTQLLKTLQQLHSDLAYAFVGVGNDLLNAFNPLQRFFDADADAFFHFFRWYSIPGNIVAP